MTTTMTTKKTPAGCSEVTHTIAAPMRALNQLQRALDVARSRTGLLSQDGALPYNPVRLVDGTMGSWEDVREEWGAQIEAERLEDVMLPAEVGGLQALAIDPRDGAWTRGGGGLAYLPSAFSQAISLMLQGVPRERGTAGVLHSGVTPPARSLAWEDLRERSPRRAAVIMRLFVHAETGVRTVRGVLSQRYPVGYFDDLQVMAVVDELAVPTSLARVWRTAYETRGSVSIGAFGPQVVGAEPVLSWRNSEVGKARLGFFAGLRITVLDEVVTLPATSLGIDAESVATYERQVTVAATSAGAERNHTLPWVDWSEDERRALAVERMRTSRNVAVDGTLELQARWAAALVDFPLSSAGARRDLPNVEVFLDLLEETGRVDSTEREAVGVIMRDEKRLPLLGLGSAAYMAGVYALLGRSAEDLDTADGWNAQAAAWLRDGWGNDGTGVAERSRLVRASKDLLDARKMVQS